MARVLKAAAVATDQHDLTEWNAHVGHQNFWYAGFRRWVIRAGLVTEGPGNKLAAISSGRMSWHGAFVKLQKCHMVGLPLHKSPIPRSLCEYKVASEHCKSLLAAANSVGLNKDCNYSSPRLIRSHVFATLRSMGIPAVKLDDTTVREISDVFPDSGGWLRNSRSP